VAKGNLGRLKELSGVLRNVTEFHVDTIGKEYKGVYQSRNKAMESLHIYGYVDMPQAPSPRVDRSRPTVSNAYRTS
jgi:hypothetical protein